MTSLCADLPDEAATLAFGARLASALGDAAACIHLEGELGAGKTTLARGLLQAAGHQGKVRSPTYSLVEEYLLGDLPCYHLDLYRVADPAELDFIGLRDMRGVLLIEWAARGSRHVPPADLCLRLARHGEGRRLQCEAGSVVGEQVLSRLGGAA